MKTTIFISTLITALTICGGTASMAVAQVCRVTDPTGTPLNVRATPNGKIINSLINGTEVYIQRITYDNLDRPWALVSIFRGRASRGRAHSTLGWVFRNFLTCYR